MKFLPGKRVVIGLLAVAAVMLLPLAASANTVYLGSLTSPSASGVAANFDWDNGGFTIAWNIFADGTYTVGPDTYVNYDYTYTVTVSGPQTKDISHLILQVSPGAAAGDFRGATPVFEAGDPTLYSTSGTSGSNPNMPQSIYGLKFSPDKPPDGQLVDVYTIHFDSIRPPEYGSFYAKDGNDGPVTAWNTGLVPNYVNGQFIGVPDTSLNPVPLPPSVLLMGSGLLGLGLIGWRRKS